MLHYSFSTVLMTVLTGAVLVSIIAVCFRSKEVLLSIGYKLLGVFLSLTLIRFVFPIEMPFSKNISLPKSLSMVISNIRHPFATLGEVKISVWFLFESIWICGAAVVMIKIVYRNCVFNRFVSRYGVDVTGKEPYSSILSKVCDSHKRDIKILLVRGLDTPRQKGIFHPEILIPPEMDLNERELYYTVSHEYSHYMHHDNVIKTGINILLAVYWWNPLTHVLSRQVSEMLEMRVDDSLIRAGAGARKEYLNTLLHIGEMLTEKQEMKESDYLASSPVFTGTNDLADRVHMMYNEGRIVKTVYLALLGLVSAVFISSYCYIFEAYYTFEEHVLDVPEINYDEMHAVMLEDGTYDIYWGEQFLEHVETLEFHPNIPVVNK